jgi:hypothetical protein
VFISAFIFIFGVLHPVARTLSRLLEEHPSQQLFKVFILYIFAATYFCPCWPSSGETTFNPMY